MLAKYANILWDFDGVILDSASVRELGFRKTLEKYDPEEVERLLAFHHDNGGLSRYVKYRYFFGEVLGKPVTESTINAYAGDFSQVMMQHLLDPALLIEEVVNFIEKFAPTVNMHVVSGSDQRELRKICAAVGVSQYFRSIHGSPTPKTQLVEELLERLGYERAHTCLIGDSVNDFEAADANGIDFYGYNNASLRPLGAGYIEKMASVEGYRGERA